MSRPDAVDDRRTALVTGAGSGIGAAVYRALVDDGLRVLGVDRDDDGLQRTVKSVSDPSSFRVKACDVRDDGSVRSAVDAAAAWGDRLDVVVNAAGVLERVQLAETTDEVWERVIDINLSGTFRVVRAARGRLLEPSEAAAKRVVNIGSGAADSGYAYPAYTASKGGVVALTRELAAEFAPFGVTVNVVNPGFVRTGMNKDTWSDERARHEREGAVPLGRLGEPEDIAALVAFLCSPRAGYITGQALRVDGGSGVVVAPPNVPGGSRTDGDG